MKRNWKTTQLLTLGAIATLDVILALSGGAITQVTGIPLAGGIINNLVENSFIVFCLLLFDRFGTGTIFRLILSLLELPLPLLGTAGFTPKIIIGVVAGFLADSLYYIFRKNKILSSFLTGGLVQIWIIVSTVSFGKLANIPGVEKTYQILTSPFLLTGSVLLGGIGGLLGFLIYEKLKKTSIIERVK